MVATKDSIEGKVHSTAPSKQLATTTDISAEGVREITKAINPLVADAFALYVKSKNFHWHLSGSHFRDYHLLFDEQAAQIFDDIDTLAERVRKLGGSTIRSVSHISELQTIKDDNDEFVEPGEMARRLMEDNAHIAEQQRAAHEVCDKYGDYATASELETIIDNTERRKWFLFELIQGIENTK